MTDVSILATCSKKPSLVVTNIELEEKLDLKPGIIERLTGIQKRHYFGKGESLQSVAADVCIKLIKRSGLNPSNLDMMIYYTEVPPTMPSNDHITKVYYEVSSHIQYLMKKRGVNIECECVNIAGSCVSFISALQIADGLIKSGAKKNILILGVSNNSAFFKDADKNVLMTFSDGTAATILTSTKEPGLTGFYRMTEGSGYEAGGFANYETLFIDRKKVAQFAPRAFQLAVQNLLKKTKLQMDDVDLFIPHQAGIRIIKQGVELSGIPPDKVYYCLQNDGNTGAPAVQIALSNAIKEKRVVDGNLIVLIAFGIGWNYGAAAFYFHDYSA